MWKCGGEGGMNKVGYFNASITFNIQYGNSRNSSTVYKIIKQKFH